MSVNQPFTKGRCLCGQTTFEYEGLESWRGHCHCESCRRNTSAPYTTFFGVPRTAYRFSGLTPAFYQSSPGVKRHFCSKCGTPIAYDNEKDIDDIHFYAASLENPETFIPEFHIFVAEKVPWVTIEDGLPQYPQSRDV